MNMKILLKRTTKKEGSEKIFTQGAIKGSLIVISMIHVCSHDFFPKKL